jgi:hypothetical protein
MSKCEDCLPEFRRRRLAVTKNLMFAFLNRWFVLISLSPPGYLWGQVATKKFKQITFPEVPNLL